MPSTRLHDGTLPEPIKVLEDTFIAVGTTIVRIAFEHSFFVPPDAVRAKTPYFPEKARKSREHYPGLDKGAKAVWQGREVELDFNHWAQTAWSKYAGRPICSEERLRGAPHLGSPVGPQCLHRGLEPLLHAVLGRHAD